MILVKCPTQGFDDTTLTWQAEYSIIFSEKVKKFLLNLHYSGSNNYLFVKRVAQLLSSSNLSIQGKF